MLSDLDLNQIVPRTADLRPGLESYDPVVEALRRKHTPGFFEARLIDLGRALTAWGCRLQLRFGALVEGEEVRTSVDSHQVVIRVVTAPGGNGHV